MIRQLYTLIFCFMLSHSLFAQDIDSDLVLQINYSNEIIDLTGNATPQPSGIETFVADRQGYANCAVRYYGGSSAYTEVPVNLDNAIVQGDEVTVSLWFRMNNLDPGGYELLFKKGIETNEDGFSLAVYDLNSPIITDNVASFMWDLEWNGDPDLPYDITNWHHFVMVLDSTTVKLYRDNEIRNSITYTGNEFDLDASMLPYILGKRFIGFLDDVRMYRRALTASEVDALYNLESDCTELAIDDFEISNIQIFSKAKNISIINLPSETVTVSIFDVMGKKVLTSKNFGNTQLQLDASMLSTGMYIIQIIGTRTNLTTKITL